MHDQQITYLSSNRRRTHTVRFLCCFAVTIANNIEACSYLSSAIFCRHCGYVRSDVCHGSTISSADFLRKLNHAHRSWPTLSIVCLLLKNGISWARLLLGWVTVCWQVNDLGIKPTPRSTQPSIPPGEVNWVSSCLAGIKVGRVEVCWVAGSNEWSHVAGDAP